MDRRQKKTRAAIFNAFSELLSEKPYGSITIQNIIDRADIGRSTFYAHFQEKNSLLKEMCEELFDHIVDGVMSDNFPDDGTPTDDTYLIRHLLQHIIDNTNHIKDLLTAENSDIFLKYFKQSLTQLILSRFLNGEMKLDVPKEFLLNHISGSFVEMVQWWVRNDMKETPEELDKWFRAVIEPLI